MRPSATIIATTLLALIPGCATGPAGKAEDHVRMAQNHTIFNPEWTGLPTMEVTYDGWPSTPAYHDTQEHIAYRETVIDFQGRSDSPHHQDYYRRFYSVRRGEARR